MSDPCSIREEVNIFSHLNFNQEVRDNTLLQGTPEQGRGGRSFQVAGLHLST